MFKLTKKLISTIAAVTVAFLMLSLCPFTSITDDSVITASAHDSYDDIKVKLNGKKIDFDVKPQLINGRTMVPLRAIFEALGATVSWDDATQTVVSTRNFTAIVMTINSPVMYVNGNTVTLDTPACLIDKRTMVPVRAISEAFGTKVDWDDATQTVDITFEQENSADGNLSFAPGIQYEIVEPLNHSEYTKAASDKVKAGIDVMGLIKPDHTLWMWGNNAKKQISSSYGDSVHTPTFVMANVSNFEIGKNHTLVHTYADEVYCLGYDGKYVKDNSEPLLKSVVSVASGYDHCLALAYDGSLYVWGSNIKGQLSAENIESIDSPEIIETNVKKVYAHKNYSVILFNDGLLKFMGDITDFKVVSGNNAFSISKRPISVFEVEKVSDISARYGAVIAEISEQSGLKNAYYIYGSDAKQRADDILNGRNREWSVDSRAWVEEGRLYSGSGSYYNYKERQCILDEIAGICESEDGTTMAILDDSSVWIWGSDKNGSLGNGYSDKTAMETPIRLFEPLCAAGTAVNDYVTDMSIHEINTGEDNEYKECVITIEFRNANGKVIRPIGMVEVEILEYSTEYNVMKNRSKFFITESCYNSDYYAELKIPYRYIGNTESGRANVKLTFIDVDTVLTAESHYVRGFRTGNERDYNYYY